MRNPSAASYSVSAKINLWLGMYNEAVAEAERALALAPNEQ